MEINITNTNYSGEVLETILTKAATGNELVERGLIRMEPGVHTKFSIPRLSVGQTLQKRKETPEGSDATGATYSERAIEPKDFMAFVTFNPRSFEAIWRPFQPKGNLVFSQLPPEAQNKLLEEINKTVDYEVGYHLINGEYAASGDDHLFNGFVYRIANDADKIEVSSSETSIVGRLKDVRKAIPKPMRNNPRLRILMSVGDADKYDEELSAQDFKGTNWTDTNPQRFKGIQIEALAEWPDDFIVATLCGEDLGTNLWAACNLVDDPDVIMIDRLTNPSEIYFLKILMKMDTQVAFGEELVVLDNRETASAGESQGEGSGEGSGEGNG